MAALLGMLPQDEQIITASDIGAIETATAEAAGAAGENSVCLLAHEVGSGPWYAYIWGRSAVAFLKAKEEGLRIVTTLHADNPAQVEEVFGRCGIGREKALSAELQLFIQRLGMSSQRRVTAIYFNIGNRMQPVFQWDRKDDRLKALLTEEELIRKVSSTLAVAPNKFRNDWESYKELLMDLREQNINDFCAVADAVMNQAESAFK